MIKLNNIPINRKRARGKSIYAFECSSTTLDPLKLIFYTHSPELPHKVLPCVNGCEGLFDFVTFETSDTRYTEIDTIAMNATRFDGTKVPIEITDGWKKEVAIDSILVCQTASKVLNAIVWEGLESNPRETFDAMPLGVAIEIFTGVPAASTRRPAPGYAIRASNTWQFYGSDNVRDDYWQYQNMRFSVGGF